MSTAWLKARITATEAQIEALETAVLELAAGSIESYTLDTGQTRQTVNRTNIATLEGVLDSLYNRRDVLRARLYGGSVTVRPDW